MPALQFEDDFYHYLFKTNSTASTVLTYSGILCLFLNKSLQPEIPAQPEPLKLCYIEFIIDRTSTDRQKIVAPDAGPGMLGYSKTLTPNSAHPLSQNLSFCQLCSMPLLYYMAQLSTSSRRVDSGIVLWDDIGERLAEDDLSPETLE